MSATMVSQQTEIIVQQAGARPAAAPLVDWADDRLSRRTLTATPGYYRRSWRRFRQNEVSLTALVGFALILAFVLAAGLIANLTGHGFEEPDLPHKLGSPLADGYLLGTDALGRDLVVRLAYGGRISLLVAGVAGLSTLAIGAIFGAVSGFFGGFVDSALMRLVDVWLNLPGFPILILIFTMYRPAPIEIALILAVFGWAGLARLVRAEVLSLRTREHIVAARVIGASDGQIIRRHLIPNVLPTMLVWASLAIPGLILTEAALSFLGFGVQIPTPSWGNMLQDARDYYQLSWTNAFIPGFMIYLTVLCTNLIGDGLRDAFDPRLNK
jgi:peptide/nickel transport system permease protein